MSGAGYGKPEYVPQRQPTFNAPNLRGSHGRTVGGGGVWRPRFTVPWRGSGGCDPATRPAEQEGGDRV